jgi:ferredoxin-NADP reductase
MIRIHQKSSKPVRLTTRLIGRRWLTPKVFEVDISRPAGFTFQPGQYVRLDIDGRQRDYSLISSAQAPHLSMCIRRIAGDTGSNYLSAASLGTTFSMQAARGYFVFRPSRRPAVFVATGTGIAPFVAYARAGIKGAVLLHGVRCRKELHYRREMQAHVDRYVACLTQDTPSPSGQSTEFAGQVDRYLDNRLASDEYDFYLCGHRQMIQTVTHLVDIRFQRSRVYSERFY